MADETRNANVVLSADISQYQQQMQLAAQQTNQLNTAVSQLTSSLDRLVHTAGRRLELFGAGTAVSLTAMTASAASFEKQLSTLAATSKVSGTNFDQLRRTVLGLSQTFPISTGAAAQLVTQISHLGLTSTAQINQFATAVTKLGGATGENVNSLAQSFIELNRTMGTLGADVADKYANSLTAVSAAAGVSANGVLQFAQLLAPFARQAQISETQLLGIAGAFNKAGADGFYAANAFNQIITDITRLTQTGSPDIMKYANLIGLTADQFKKLPAATQMAELFDAINKQGPQAVQTLSYLGIEGARSARAIQAVASSGSLRQLLGVSAAPGDSLNKGAAEAFNTLSDSLSKLKNQFQEIGIAIGSTFLGPAKLAVNIFTSMASAVNTLMQGPLGKVAGIGAMAGSIGLLGGGFLLSNLGRIATGTSLIGLGNNRVTRSIIGGIGAGLGRETMAMEDYTAGNMGAITSRLFLGSYGIGQGIGNLRGRLAGAGGDFGRAGGALGAMFALPQMFLGAGRDSARNLQQMDPFQRPQWYEAFTNRLTGGESTTKSVSRLTKYFDELGDSTTKLSGHIGKTALLFAQMQLAGANTVGRYAARGIGRGIGAVGGALLGGLGPIGVGLAGLAAGGYIYDTIQQNQYQAQHPSDQMLFPINAYNAALGIATISLQQFTTATDKATGAQTPHGTTATQARTVSPADVNTASSPGRQLINPTITQYQGSVAQTAAFMTAQGQLGPDQIKAITQDIIQANGGGQAGAGFAQQVLNRYYSTGGGGAPSNAAVSGAVRTLGQGGGANAYNSWNAIGNITGGSPDMRAKFNTAAGAIKQQVGQETSKYGAKAGKQLQAILIRQFLAGVLATKPDYNTWNAAFDALNAAQLLTNDPNNPMGASYHHDPSQLFGQPSPYLPDFKGGDAASRAAAQYFSGVNTGTTNLGAVTPFEAAGAPKGSNITRLQAAGGYSFTLGSAAGQQGIAAIDATGQATNSTVVYQTTQSIIASMRKAGMSWADIDKSLQDQKAALGSSNSSQYQYIDQIQQTAKTMSQWNTSNQNIFQNIAQANQAFAAALATQGGSADTGAYQAQAQAAHVEAVNQQMATYRQIIMADQDFHKQRARAEHDFQVQMTESRYQYNISRVRAERDFNHQILLLTKQVASETYNVYQRLQTNQTFDADSLLTNIQRQTAQIQGQVQNLGRLRQMGVSQNVIDILGLSDPNNAQQVARYVSELAKDPSLVKAFNDSIKNRLDWTKGLVTDKSSTSYREMKYQFDVAASDAAQSFTHSMGVAKTAFDLSMTRMEQDYSTSVQRAAGYLEVAGKDIFDNFAALQNTAFSIVATNSGQLASKIISDINQVRKAAGLPTVAGGTGGGSSSVGAGSHGAPGAMAGKPGAYGGYSWVHGGSGNMAPTLNPVTSTERQQIGNTAANAEQRKINERNELLAAAYGELGVPYRWGGDDPKTGFDCSGLVYWAESHAHLGLGRTTAAQYQKMSRKTSGPIPGDLVFYGSPAHHVGIYVGNGMMIDAPHTGAQVRVEAVGKPTNYGVLPGLAAGGIAFSPSIMAEAGPEAAIPLDARGAHFLAKFMMVTMDQMKQTMVSGYGVSTFSGGGFSQRVNASTHFNGDIHVEANDPNAFVYKVAQRKRLSALTRPVQGGRG